MILFTGDIQFTATFTIELPWLKMGYHVFLITAVLSLLAEIGFIRLGKTMGKGVGKR